MDQHRRTTRSGVSRRAFLQGTAGAGVLLGVGARLSAGTPPPRGAAPTARSQPRTEPRTYLFNLSHMDTSRHDVILVAGKQRVKLKSVTPATLKKVRQEHPLFNAVPDAHLTHRVEDLAMPAEAVQLCYLQRVARGKKDGSWDMALLFSHHPTAALLEARQRGKARAGEDAAPVPVKWARYGITPEIREALNDPVGEEMLQDTASQAVTLVAHHPELVSLEPTSAADVHNIIGAQRSILSLSQVLQLQGPATPTGGWATLTPLINPETGQPYTNSQGQVQYVPVWSQTTGELAGLAMLQALDTVKNDSLGTAHSLGVNITGIDPTTITTNDPNAPTHGKIWTLHDGMPAVGQSASGGLLETGLAYQLTNQSPDYGYAVAVTGVDSSLNVTITAQNWAVRYLSLYIRYLNASDQPIALSSLASAIQDQFPLWDLQLNGEFDALLHLINPQFTVLGIPVQTTTVTTTFPLPPGASKALLLAGGLGRGDNPYPATIGPGKTLTVVVNLAVPTFFLALAAAAALGTFVLQIQDAGVIKTVVQLLVTLFEDIILKVQVDDPLSWQSVAVTLGQALLGSAAVPLVTIIAASIAEGEVLEAVTDAIPVVGTILSAIFAAGLLAQVIETSVEVAQSPQTYVDKLTVTHDVVVTISSEDPAGWPATATSYTATAQFDNGTPHNLGPMALTGAPPLQVTFPGVPFGGMVAVNVGVYSANGWLAGQGGIGPVPNASGSCTTLTRDGSLSCQTSQTPGDLALSFAITENLVPLTNTTTYSHKEVIELDAAGRHVWQATTTPPAVVTPQGLCENVDGQLCALTGVTISTTDATVGYAWQAFDQTVVDCASGATGQLNRFANLSITENPQSSYLFSGCGFSGTVRLVYDLLGKQDWNFYLDPTNGGNYIRQIRLSAGGASSYDSPTSDKAFGKLHFRSDALLLHPLGKILSINSELNKIEVLTLPVVAVPDADAPSSQVYSGKGIREGRLQGPTLAALAPDGTILILETKNNRIQAFDLSANPKRHFKEGAYVVPLVDPPDAGVTYLDLAVEYSGYLYVLSYTGEAGAYVYRLDLYTPAGDWLARTSGVTAARLAVNYWRDVFTVNYQVLTRPDGSLPAVTEPSVSHWIPSTP